MVLKVFSTVTPTPFLFSYVKLKGRKTLGCLISKAIYKQKIILTQEIKNLDVIL